MIQHTKFVVNHSSSTAVQSPVKTDKMNEVV